MELEDHAGHLCGHFHQQVIALLLLFDGQLPLGNILYGTPQPGDTVKIVPGGLGDEAQPDNLLVPDDGKLEVDGFSLIEAPLQRRL